MTLRLVIASHKGGVGKSTIALNLAVAFAHLGYRTALIDTDPQGALNLSLARGSREFEGLSEVLWGKARTADVLLPTKMAGLSLLTRGRAAMKHVPQYERKLYDSGMLGPIMDELAAHHDVVVCDTPAGLGMVTRAALKAAGHVLVPFKVDSLNLRSVNQILSVLEAVRAEENPDLCFLGLLLNMFEKESARSFRIAAEVWQDFPLVMETTIPYADIFARASELGAPLALLGTREHPEARRFTALAQEIMARVDPVEEHDDEVRQLL